MEKNDWRGACHAVSAICFVLLKEQGIKCELRLGEVGIHNVVFNHSWIVIDQKVFDLAIYKSLEPKFDQPPTIAGINVDTLLPTELNYGVNSSLKDDPPTAMIKTLSLSEYMSGFPNFPNGLFYLVDKFAQKIDFKVNIQDLIQKYTYKPWTF